MARTKHGWLVVAIAVLPLAAHASEPAVGSSERSLDECNADAAGAQRQRRAGKLLAARDQFRLCAREECPTQLASFCLDRLAETEAALPTLVIRARDASGTDVPDLDVSIDGNGAGKADGRAIAVDPGPRSIRVSGAATALSATMSIVVAEGEKLRPVTLTVVLPAPEPRPAPRPSPARSPLPYVLAGAGAVSAGVGIALWASGLTDRSGELEAGGCAPNCSDSVKDSIRQRLIAGDVLVVLGVVSLGVATYLFLRSPPRAATPAR